MTRYGLEFLNKSVKVYKYSYLVELSINIYEGKSSTAHETYYAGVEGINLHAMYKIRYQQGLYDRVCYYMPKLQ